jgi:hypothetical protein
MPDRPRRPYRRGFTADNAPIDARVIDATMKELAPPE